MATFSVREPLQADGTARSASLAPVLEDDTGPLPQRLARLAGTGHPVRTFLLGIALAYVVIAGLSILLGLLVTHVLVQSHGIASADESAIRFFVRHRSADLTTASLIGSIVAGGVVLPIVAGVWAVVLAAFRQWRLAAFLPFALGVESASYRTTTLLVHRDRPSVHRLENLPVDASYPSGHTAASIAVYCGIALLVTSRIRDLRVRIAVWALAAAVPVYVALSRMYRGMHHPLDVAGGAVIGIAALTALVVVCRATGRAAARRAA